MDIPTDKPGFYKNENAIINKDNSALNVYKKRKRKEKLVNTMSEKMEKMEDQIQEIRKLLLEVLNK